MSDVFKQQFIRKLVKRASKSAVIYIPKSIRSRVILFFPFWFVFLRFRKKIFAFLGYSHHSFRQNIPKNGINRTIVALILENYLRKHKIKHTPRNFIFTVGIRPK